MRDVNGPDALWTLSHSGGCNLGAYRVWEPDEHNGITAAPKYTSSLKLHNGGCPGCAEPVNSEVKPLLLGKKRAVRNPKVIRMPHSGKKPNGAAYRMARGKRDRLYGYASNEIIAAVAGYYVA